MNLKSYVETDRFEEDLALLSRPVKWATWLIIAMAVYVFGPAIWRVVREAWGYLVG
jgi:hypothetical protein